MRRQHLVLYTIVFFVLTTFWTLQYNSFWSYSQEDIIRIKNSRKMILYWNSFFQRKDWYIGFGSKMFEQCEYKNCFMTNNKHFLPVDEFDAIMFSPYDLYGIFRPRRRKVNQVFVFYNLESPQIITDHYKSFHDFYNLTMTYRKDSDIIRPYGHFSPVLDNKYKLPEVTEINKRPKKIAWFVSHCDTPSQREKLGEELSKYIPVDIYGRCGNLQCPKSDSKACYKMVETDYKFYLSFENSICEDYVTEKAFRILMRDIVPIVYGGVNYTADLPPHSVINVMDFDNITGLVNYINFLDQNPEEYLKYFEWKKSYEIIIDDLAGVCTLCKKLNENYSRTYQNIADWWIGTDRHYCRNDFLDKFINKNENCTSTNYPHS